MLTSQWATPSRSFSNGNGPPAGPASVTITGAHLGAGDDHWWRLV